MWKSPVIHASQFVVCCGMEKIWNGTMVESDDVRARLTAAREALLQLHKTLLDAERVSYEATFGRITSPYQFLHLLTNDGWFAWLAPVTQLLVAMDEMLDAPEPVTPAGVDGLVMRMKRLLVPTSDGVGFSRHYDEVLQRNPDALFAHAAAVKLIRTKNLSPGR